METMSDGSRVGFLALKRLVLDQLRTGVLRFCDLVGKVPSGRRSEPSIAIGFELAAQKPDQIVMRRLPHLLENGFKPLPVIALGIHQSHCVMKKFISIRMTKTYPRYPVFGQCRPTPLFCNQSIKLSDSTIENSLPFSRV